jgi:hypothetical protein
MNRDAGDLREFFLHADFQLAGDVVDLSDGQAFIHDAVAGHQDVVLPPDSPGGQSTTVCLAGKSFSVYNHLESYTLGEMIHEQGGTDANESFARNRKSPAASRGSPVTKQFGGCAPCYRRTPGCGSWSSGPAPIAKARRSG